ncbi:MAG: polysaccharide deacetylase family protein [Clostridiales bacterium]|jgi:peptidoglycan/xylan/chitin deacetylase (PgdA/CDA1 family)|nr:polysaccharide deacetylase family protein [Clostridiales bacterium]
MKKNISAVFICLLLFLNPSHLEVYGSALEETDLSQVLLEEAELLQALLEEAELSQALLGEAELSENITSKEETKPTYYLAKGQAAENTFPDPSKPMIALTFDDGPGKYTPQILDLLKRYDVRASFCVVGYMIESHRDIIEKSAENGNEIIGHSWSHTNLTKLSRSQIKDEIVDTNSLIESVTGSCPNFYRPPFGDVNDNVRKVSEELGAVILYWSVDTRDWQSKDAQKVSEIILSEVKDGSVILCHDLYASTYEAMRTVIPELIERGYQFVTVSELINFNRGTAEAGKLYYGTQ